MGDQNRLRAFSDFRFLIADLSHSREGEISVAPSAKKTGGPEKNPWPPAKGL